MTGKTTTFSPGKRRRNHGSCEGADAFAKAINSEAVDVEGERPCEPNTAVERVEDAGHVLPGFED